MNNLTTVSSGSLGSGAGAAGALNKAKTSRDDKNSKPTTQVSFEKQVRERLEKACEEEKSRSVIVKRCERIYEQIIKNECEQLYNHLIVVN